MVVFGAGNGSQQSDYMAVLSTESSELVSLILELDPIACEKFLQGKSVLIGRPLWKTSVSDALTLD